MKDDTILEKIAALVEREHDLLEGRTGASSDGALRHQDLRAVEVELDQCWDLLRQRRARQEFKQPRRGNPPVPFRRREPLAVERLTGTLERDQPRGIRGPSAPDRSLDKGMRQPR